MSVRPFLPKDDQALPDAYSMEIQFIDGRSETFELASHMYKDGQFEFVTFDDEWHWIPTQNVKLIKFDKRFSKIVALKNTSNPE